MSESSNYRVRLTFVGDNKSALAATKELETASTEQTDVIEANNDRAAESADRLGKSFGGLKGLVSNAMGTIGLVGAGFGLDELVKSGEQRQAQLAQLTNTLKNTGQYHAGITDKIVSNAETISEHGGLSVSNQLTQIQALTSETGSLSEAQKANVAVQNIVRSGLMSQSQALKSYQGALNGTPGRLQKIIGVIVPVTKYTQGWTAAMQAAYPVQYAHQVMLNKQATAMEVTARVQQKLGGAMSTYSNTTKGQISNLENTFENLADKVSMALLPVFTKLIGIVDKTVTFFMHNKTAAIALGVALGTLAAAWGTLKVISVVSGLVNKGREAFTALMAVQNAQKAVMEAWTGSEEAMAAAQLTLTEATEAQTKVQWLFNTAMDANPMVLLGIAIAAVVAALGYLAIKTGIAAAAFNDIKSAAVAAFNFIKTLITDVVSWIGSHWKMLAVGGALFLGGPFLALPVFVATHFAEVKHWVLDLFNFIEGIFSKVAHVLEAPFLAAWHVIQPVINDVHKAFGVIGSILGTSGGGGLLHGFGLFHSGGFVHRATGGPLGGFSGLIPGYGGGDSVPLMAERGEYVMRKEAVSSIGVQNLNSINQTGSLASGLQNGVFTATAPINIRLGSRIIAQETVHFSLRQTALSGSGGAV